MQETWKKTKASKHIQSHAS